MAQVHWKTEAQRQAQGIRRRVLEHSLKNDGGYMSQACSSAELLAVLYHRVLRLGPLAKPLMPRPFPGVPSPHNPGYFLGNDFHGPTSDQHDRFILSPTHYSLVLYAALIEAGRLAPEGLLEFNKDGSSVEMIGAEHSPGMEVMTGSLGQGLSQGVGMALGRKLKGATGRVVVMMSDGEFQIGMTWEAVQFMAHHRLDNVLVFVDANQQQCDGLVSSVMTIEPLEQRLKAFGARVAVVDGHDLGALARPASLRPNGKPLFVIARTDPCHGLELLRRNAPRLHYLRFKGPDDKQAYQQVLGAWNEEGN
jgi:transketolase